MTSSDILRLIGYLLQVLAWLIIARALLSWFPNLRGNALVDLIHQLTDPVLIPLQRIIPRIGMIDISPMVATLVLFAISTVLLSSS